MNKIAKCFSCPGDCKELSKKTKRSTYDSNQARTKPWPTRPPTSDNNSPITKRIRTNETQNVSLTLATVEDCRRKQGDGTVGMQEWVIQIPSIPILVSVLFPSLHLKYFRIKFLLLVI